MIPALVPVRDVHRIDPAVLQHWMEKHVEGFSGAITAHQFQGGQSNPTYHLAAGGQEYVLRRKPPGKLLPSAHAVDREYRVITALQGTGVPVPRTYVYCDDVSIVGTPFYVMSYVRGRLFRDPHLAGATPAERTAIYDSMNQIEACLHTLDPQALGLADFGRPGNYYARQIHRWSQQYKISETEKIESMERLMEWLPANIPPGDETTLVHGDYRAGNMLMHETEPRVLAVLDWELSTLGHPLADLAYNCMPWRLSNEWEGLVGRDLVALGIPTEEAYVGDYCRRTGRLGIPDWDWYIAFAMFRLSAIAQGIMGRVRDGTANDPEAAERGRRARPLAESGWKMIEQRAR